MKKILLANSIVHLLLTLFISTSFLAGCKKSDNNAVYAAPPDLTTKTTSSVSGFVTDENDAAVKNATVQFGSATLFTDKYGYFETKNIEVVKDAATVTITKPGYFKGIKTYMTTAGKSAFFRIKLIPKTIAGTVNGSTDGTVTLSNGLTVNLPANAAVNATTNAAYTGTINVAAFWINPTSTDLPNIMPGDLRGVNTDGNVQLLTTYGMAAVELTGSSGELLQIAAGKKATISLPIPPALSSSAPASIPLWYFNETNGLWKEEGSAIKTGNNYVGEVTHFSFWNCDMPNAIVPFTLTVLNAGGQPVQNTLVKFSLVNNPAGFGYGYTDATGFLNGFLTANTQMLMEILGSSCSGPAYSQSFTTTTAPISFGNITIGSASAATVSGTITNCNNNPVTNGYVIVIEPNRSITRYNTDNTGYFIFSRILCSSGAPVVLVGEDIATLQQSNSLNLTLNAGTNNAGNLKACGISAQEYFYYTVDGVNYLMAAPQDSIAFTGKAGNPEAWIYAYEKTATSHNVFFQFFNFGIAQNSNQSLMSFSSTKIPPVGMIAPYGLVYIKEYGVVGQFISGDFSGSFVEQSSNPSIFHTISCSFRARRRE